MALHHFPRIVTDNLVLCLDAGNPLSYPVGPELWDGTVSPTIFNFGGTTGYYDIATKTMHSPTSSAYVDVPRFTFNLGLTTGKLYSIVGMLSGDLDDLTTGGRISPNITLNTVTGEINTTFTAVNESIWFRFNANFSPSSVTIESLSVREVTSVWKDLSGNGNNGTLVNGPAYSSANGGILSFDGVNDRIECGTFSVSFLTVSTWVYKTTSTSNQGICRKQNGWAVSNYQGVLQVAPGTAWQFFNTGYTIPLNTWVNIVYTYSGTGATGSQAVYINGSSIYSTSAGSGAISANANQVRVGYDDNNWFWNGRIAQTQIYNKALTSQQILDNYRATKGRYGL